MENDDYLPQGRSGFKVLVIMLLFLMVGLGVAGYIDGQRRHTESNERMYLACLDKLVAPDHPKYIEQLNACKGTK